MKKRFLAMFLAFVMTLALMLMSASATRYVGQYDVDIEGPSYVTSENPFYPKWWKQCTWYCWGRAKEKCGVSLPCRGNAETWYNGAENSGLSVGTEPRANSIAVFRGVGSETVGIGHVLFVEKVEGTTAYCTEGNYIYSPEYHETTFDTSTGVAFAGNSKWEQRLIGYIYLDSGFSTYRSGEDIVLSGYQGPGGNVTIPNSVTRIGYGAFQGCTHLTSVTIPNSVTSIEGSAFGGCTGLTSITIPNSVTRIGGDVFSNCTSLTSISIPDSVTNIEQCVFASCTSLTSVTIPNSVTKIERQAFDHCTGLTSVSIPDSVTSIGPHAFGYCTGLSNVTIPARATSIEEGAFSYCTGLTSITIPDSVTCIENWTFQECAALISVTIPASVSSIGAFAFYRCTSLKNVYYAGTEAQWKSISILSDNDALHKATIHYNSTGPEASTTPDKPTQPAKDVAHASAQTVTVDGKPVEFQMYALKDASGSDTNYIKLRDMAYVLNGTKAQFSVGYNVQDKTITATTGAAYEEDGTEMKATFGGADKEYTKTTLTIQLDGKPVQLEAITLTDSTGGGYNYCKVRDLGQTFNFNVDWNTDVGIYIESGKPYSG